MATDIPVDQALTKEHREYLRARGAWGQAMITRIDGNYPPDPADLVEPPSGSAEVILLVGQNRELADEVAELKRLLANANAVAAQAPVQQVQDNDLDAEPYENWTKADLEAEVETRNAADGRTRPPMSKSGTKAELAERLYADDAEEDAEQSA